MYLETKQMLNDLHLFLVKRRRTGYTQMLIRLLTREKICIIFPTLEETQDMQRRLPEDLRRSVFLSLGQLGKEVGTTAYPTFLDNSTIMEVAGRAICAIEEVTEKLEKSQQEVERLKAEFFVCEGLNSFLRDKLKKQQQDHIAYLDYVATIEKELDAFKASIS